MRGKVDGLGVLGGLMDVGEPLEEAAAHRAELRVAALPLRLLLRVAVPMAGGARWETVRLCGGADVLEEKEHGVVLLTEAKAEGVTLGWCFW